MVPKNFGDDHTNAISVSPMVVLVAGTVIVVFVAIVVFIILWKKTKLNWYDKKNLIVFLCQPPNYILCTDALMQ